MTTTMGGFRVVRRLGAGEHGTVFVAHPLDGGPAVALKLAVEDSPERALREIEALDRGAGDHVVRLLDAATDDRGMPAVVMQRHPGITLADLLVRRERLTPGEARAVLDALGGALTRLHAAGVVHGGVRADAVLLTAEGRPVLAGFGAARVTGLNPSRAARDADPAMRSDCEGVRTVALAVLAASSSFAALDAIAALDGDAALLEELGRQAAQLGAARPLLPVDESSETPVLTVPRARAEAVAAVEVKRRGRRAAPTPALHVRARRALLMVVGRARAMAGTVRPRFWIVGGAGVLALVAALVLLPVRATDAQPPSDPQETATSAAEPAPDTAHHAAPPLGVSVPQAETVDAAVVRLLERRAACVRERSVACLGDVVHAGSSAQRDDETLIRSLDAGEVASDRWSDVDLASVSVIDEYGGAALVALVTSDGEPAPILVMRTEAGWRIRSYLGDAVAP